MSDYYSNINLRFARTLNDHIVCISDLSPDERDLNFYCPDCREPVAARLGMDRHWYFAHVGIDCCRQKTSVNETALHLIAKEILVEKLKFKLPPYILYGDHALDGFDPEIIDNLDITERYALLSPYWFGGTRDFIFDADQIFLERRIGDIIPDVLICAGSERLIIEIAVTHFVDDEKLARIKALGISAIEIDLSDAQNRDIGRDELEALIVDGLAGKTWLYYINHRQARSELIARNQHLYSTYLQDDGLVYADAIMPTVSMSDVAPVSLVPSFGSLVGTAPPPARVIPELMVSFVPIKPFDKDAQEPWYDQNGVRWLYCWNCGEIKPDEKMVSYQYSQGLCRECSRKYNL